MLPHEVPNVETLLAMAPEELAPTLLRLASRGLQNGIFSFDQITGEHSLYAPRVPDGYRQERSQEIWIAVAEGWHWLEINMLILPAPGLNGANRFKVISRRGARMLADPAAFRSYTRAVQFPKSMLHPAIAERVWLALARGDLPDAVFIAFRAVEEAVREAGGFRPEDIGTDLMRAAFNADNGPLSKQTDPMAERLALAHLFAGAIGSYKNPHSHRTVTLAEPQEAQEMVVLASHLLRIVDERAAARRARPA